jgi:hypothetical protein
LNKVPDHFDGNMEHDNKVLVLHVSVWV